MRVGPSVNIQWTRSVRQVMGVDWGIFIKRSEVLGDSPALTCLIFFPNMEALVSMTNTTFLGTTGRSLGAK